MVSSGVLIKQQAGYSAQHYHAYGIYLEKVRSHKRRGKQEHAYAELPRIYVGSAEILGVHEYQRRSGYQSHNGGAYHGKYAVDHIVVAIFYEQACDGVHKYERRQHHCERGRYAAYDSQPLGIAGIHDGGVSHVRGGIYSYRAGRHLTNGYDVGELLRRKPVVAAHHFALNHRNHGIASAEAEKAYNKKGVEQQQE